MQLFLDNLSVFSLFLLFSQEIAENEMGSHEAVETGLKGWDMAHKTSQ